MNIAQTRTLGVSEALITVLIWAVFLIDTRFTINGKFFAEEVMVLRLVTTSIISFPIMIELGVIPHEQGFISTIIIALVPSAVSPHIISSGLFYASASESGALAPGTLLSGQHCLPF